MTLLDTVHVNGKDYTVANGTYYGEETSTEVINILETVRQSGQRIRIFYGSTDTGRDWMEEHDTIGTVGRSTGTIKIPLLIANSRSLGGGGILTHSIVRITAGGRDLYRHPLYHQPTLTTGPSTFDDAPYGVFENGENLANFKTAEQATRWVAFIQGERNAK